MATVELKGQLKLRGQAWVLRKQIDGRRKDYPLRVYGGAANRPAAEKAAQALERDVLSAHSAVGLLQRAGLHLPKPTKKGDVPLFSDWWTEYEKTYVPLKAKRTQTRDKQVVSRWLPLFGHLRLDEIKQIHCLAALQERRKSNAGRADRKTKRLLAEPTVQRERRLIQAIFERAVENDIITKNPWKGVERKADPTRSDRILSEEDEPKLVAALTDERRDAVGRMVAMDPRYLRFVTFMLETGLRIDEILNDRFKDNGDHVTVVGKFDKQRHVPLTKKARKALDDQLTADGKIWWQIQARFRGVLKTACERAGIRHMSPHDLRHTFGHRYLVKGGDIYTLSKILGHASVAVTEKHYGYLSHTDVATKMLAVMEPGQTQKAAEPAP